MRFTLKIGSCFFFFFARLQWVIKMKIKVIEDFKKRIKIN